MSIARRILITAAALLAGQIILWLTMAKSGLTAEAWTSNIEHQASEYPTRADDGARCIVLGQDFFDSLSSSQRSRADAALKRVGVTLEVGTEANRSTLHGGPCVAMWAEPGLNTPFLGRSPVMFYGGDLNGYEVWSIHVFGHWVVLYQWQRWF